MLVQYGLLLAFSCVAMNHLGLVATAERILRHKLPVLNCAKCSTFWLTLGYGCHHNATINGIIISLAVAFALAYLAIWIELLMGSIDNIYLYLYDTLYAAETGAATNAAASEREENPGNADADSSDGSVSGVWEPLKFNLPKQQK